MPTILLLTISNIFMTFAWYGHLNCFQVPANRIGSYQFDAAQLKTIQEIITLSIFPVFSVVYLGDKFRWNYAVGFAFIVIAAVFVFHKW